jgi:hypothetical protein
MLMQIFDTKLPLWLLFHNNSIFHMVALKDVNNLLHRVLHLPYQGKIPALVEVMFQFKITEIINKELEEAESVFIRMATGRFSLSRFLV